jgi:hypothetical protein
MLVPQRAGRTGWTIRAASASTIGPACSRNANIRSASSRHARVKRSSKPPTRSSAARREAVGGREFRMREAGRIAFVIGRPRAQRHVDAPAAADADGSASSAAEP